MLNRGIEERTCVSRELLYMGLYIFLIISSMVFMFTMKFFIFAVVTLYFLSIIFYIKYKNARFQNSEKWLETNASIINANIIKCICFSAFKVRANENEVYRPNIVYRYTFDGKEISSNQYARSYDDLDCNFNYSKIEAQNIVNEIKKNKTMKIFVNKNTGKSVITLDKAKGYGIPYVGMIITSLMILFLVYKL